MTVPDEIHATQETLIDYFAGELAPADENALEAHLMRCSACSEQAERIAAVTEGVRGLLPALATTELLAALRDRGLRVEENPMAPGDVRDVVLGPHLDLLVHRLGGIDPSAKEVSFTMRVAETGRIMLDFPHAPVDPASGSVLLLCHKHYVALPPNLVAEVRARDAGGVETVSEYTIRHRYVS